MTDTLRDPFDDELDRFLHRHAELLDGVPDERAVVAWIEMRHSQARLRRVSARTWLVAAAVVALTTALALSAFVGSHRPNPPVNIIPSVPMEVRTYAEDGYQIDLPTILLEESNADTADLPRWRGVRTFQAAGLPPRLLYVSYGSPDGVVGLPTDFGSTGVSGPVSISAETLRVPGSFAGSHLASLYSTVSVEDSSVGGESAEVTITQPRVGTWTRVEFVIAVHDGRPLILRFLLIGPFADERNVRAVLEGFAFLESASSDEPSDDAVLLLTGVPPGARSDSGQLGCYTNSAAGPLIVDPKYGTAIIDNDVGGSTTPVAWRPGFTGRRAGSEVEVLDPDGNVVATTGQRYRIAGGYVDGDSSWPQVPLLVFWACDFVTPLP